MVYGIGRGQGNVGMARFESIGGAEQIDFAVFERRDCRASGFEALNPDGQSGYLAQDAGVISGIPFVVVTAGGQVKGWIIRGGCSEAQFTLLFEPLLL
ncbi:hypothetical protein D3C80_1415330 [compost metagenome]